MTLFFILIFCIALVSAFKQPQWSLIALGATLPLYVVRGDVFSMPTTVLEMCVLGVVCGVLVRARIRTIRKHSTFLLYASAFLYISTLACIASPAFTQAAGIWKAYCVEPVLVGLCVLLTFTQEKEWRYLWSAMLCSGVVISILCIVQYFTHTGIPEPWNVVGNIRTTAVYGYPNAVGLFLAPLTTLCLGWSFEHKRFRTLLLCCTALFCFAIVLSRSDGALVSVLAALFVLLLAYRAYIVATILALCGTIATLLIPSLQAIVTLRDTSGDVRRALWHGTLNLLTHQPLLGAGLANFPAAYNQYRLPSHVELLEYAHNNVLDFWAQFGIGGVVWLCALFIACIVYILKAQQRSWPLVAVAISILVYGLVDVPYFKNDLSILCWILIANFFWNYKNKK
ncbi:MAG: O-antigen ligase family protein [Candidatus Kerfeldbacteria bacterium]|nr:O-antigen ligase family protein [Candidatus Kerfeldbacteria bacterium]